MDIKQFFNEKLNKLLFLEIKKETIKRLFDMNISKIYLPVKSEDIINTVKTDKNADEFSLASFVEGMFYVIGLDGNFKYNDIYKELIRAGNENISFIKGKIYSLIKGQDYVDSYILIKGLVSIESSQDNYDKLFIILDYLRQSDSMYKMEELDMIESAEKIEEYRNPYLYKCKIKNEDGDFEAALSSIEKYISLGGVLDKELNELKVSLDKINQFEKGKRLLENEPVNALKLFIPLIDSFESIELYYNIAVAYRKIENYEKAIYYLNEAYAIDNNYSEVINELGINYACIGNYKNAIKCFRKVFEVTKSIETCTNIIMCYINIGDKAQAELHLKIAEKLAPNDDVVQKLKEMLSKKK